MALMELTQVRSESSKMSPQLLEVMTNSTQGAAVNHSLLLIILLLTKGLLSDYKDCHQILRFQQRRPDLRFAWIVFDFEECLCKG